MKLDGNGAIVTGAGSGIGEAVASCLASAGAEVVTVGRTLSKLDTAKSSAGKAGERLYPYAADLSDPQAVRELYIFARIRLPRIDILVNNAGTNVPDRALPMLSGEDFTRS